MIDVTRAETPTAQGMSFERRAELWRTYQGYTEATRRLAWENYERWRAVPIERRQPIRGPKPPVCITCGAFPTGHYHDWSPRFDHVHDRAIVLR